MKYRDFREHKPFWTMCVGKKSSSKIPAGAAPAQRKLPHVVRPAHILSKRIPKPEIAGNQLGIPQGKCCSHIVHVKHPHTHLTCPASSISGCVSH